MSKNFQILVNKLNSFRVKYYSYKLFKGFILIILMLLVVYTAFSLVEYFVYLSTEIRKIFFYGFLFFALLLIVQFVGLPVLKLLHILTPIDLISTSTLIQKHFTEIQDKLLNIIELSDLQDGEYSKEIVLASIDQKIEQLKVFDFNDAIQFKNIRNILFYFIISIIFSAGIFILNRAVYTDSIHRLVHFNKTFVKPAPFTFNLLNTSLQAKKGDSYTIKVNVTGKEIPQIIYINIGGNNYLMKGGSDGYFDFEIVSVINTVQFYFTDLKYNSEIFNLMLLPKPGIISFKTTVFPPVYTGIQTQVFENIGDLQVPNGSEIEWSFIGIDVDSLFIVLKDSTNLIAENINNNFKLITKIYKSTSYNVFVKNRITKNELALSYSVEIIPDLFPEIQIIQMKDSLQLSRFFFKGMIGDDYGFSNLRFHYNIDNKDSTITIPFVKSLTDQEFYFSIDFNEIPEKEGIVSYYFSVTDNDIINNLKTTTSENYIFKFPNHEEIMASDKEKFDILQKNIEESKKLAGEIQKDLKNLQLKNMDSNVSDWEKSQMVSDIISKQNKLEQLYDRIKKENENMNNFLNSFNQQNDEIMAKQMQIEELLEEVFTDELKKLMEEFNKLADEFDSKKLNDLSKNMDLTFDDLQKQLDRNLEMLRKMKIEQKIQDVINEVNDMALEENNLAEQINEQKNFDEVKEQVNKHQEELKKLEENLKDALDLNKELEKPMNFDDFEEDFKNVDESFDKSKQELEKRNKKKASERSKEISEKLKNMAFGMQQMLDMNSQEQNLENIENLKQILSNLIFLSFNQENILTELQSVSDKDPMLIQLNQNQKKILDQSKIVKDSLYSLAMRTPQISSIVNNELLTMEMNLNKAVEEMQEALFPNARASQQFVITALNNMALMLNEALENLEEQMANAQPGDQKCEKPGEGKSGMNSLKESAESIKDQLQKMIDQMKNDNSQNLSKQLGESLMQHEMMQQMLRDLMNNGGVGSDAKSQLQQIDKLLEQNRKELMNKSINAQTIARQNLISTRLLSAEKAEFERDFEDKRESESAYEFYSNPVKFFEYKENDNFTIEYLNRNSHKLNNFYNNKYKQYLNSIENKK